MHQDCNLRLQKLELEQLQHKNELKEIKRNEINILRGLNQINKTMTKTKTAVYTVVLVMLLQKLGLLETIKLIFQ